MTSAGATIIKVMPKDPGYAAGQSLTKGTPKKPAHLLDHGATRAINKARVNEAGFGIVQEFLKDTTRNADQGVRETPMVAMNNMGCKNDSEIKKGSRPSISDKPKDTSNGEAQTIIRAIPKGISNGVEQTKIKAMHFGTNNARKPSGKPRDSFSSAGDSVSNVASDSSRANIYRGAPRDALHGADSHITTIKSQNGSHKIECKRLGDPNKNWTPNAIRPSLWAVAAPTFLATLCFAQSLMGEFVHDDVWAILNNPDSRGETPLRNIFMNDFWGKAMSDNTSHKSYRPLCVLTFRLNVFLGGLDPFYFHAVNVALHCTVSSLLMFTCSKAVFDDQRQALATALLFSCHPIHTEAVAGIVGRADVMSCLLFLLTFLSYIRSVEFKPLQNTFPSTVTPFFLILCLVLGTCAMLVKETGVTVFGVCLAYDLLFLCPKRFKRPSSPDHPLNVWYVAGPFLKRAALVSCYVAVVLYFRVRIMGGSMPLFSEQDNPASFSAYILSRFLTYSYLLAFNAWLLLAPITLCYDWQVGSIPLIHSIWDERNIATLLFLGILLSVGFHCLVSSKRNEHREILVGLLFLVFPFIPASNLFFRVGFVVAERVLYMPSMGFCILSVHGLKILYSRTGPRGSSFLNVCFLFLLFFFSYKTISQSECWRSREALFRSGVQTLPHNAKVHYNYANFLKDQNRKEEARNHYRTVLRLYPQHPSALNNLGTLTSNVTAAEEYYHKALSISPQHSRALFNLGNLLRTQDRNDEAEALLTKSIRYGPHFADAYSSLGSLLADQKMHKEADDVYQAGIRNCPESSDLQNNYGVFLVDVGDPQKAISHYMLALQLRPDHHVAMLNLGRLFRSMGQNTEAEMWYKKALLISKDVDVITPLGALYYNTGKYEEALHLYQEAVGLHPDNVQIHLSLAQVLSAMDMTVEAEKQIHQMTEDFPNCIECFRLLSAIYSKIENYLKALEMIDIALQMNPVDPKIMTELHFTKGNQLRELNRLEESFKSYKVVADLNPKQAQAWMNMGGIKHIQGDYISARTFYQKALLLDPDSKLLKENLAKLKRLEKRLQDTNGRSPDLKVNKEKQTERSEKIGKGSPRSNGDL
uniref:dolichyl-phosphate-mannose--protein mannosyltransferase n=1 Tax=Leptobrachium leishanense TaxID=445787 RepID=A0A8C5MUF3_9ANUR